MARPYLQNDRLHLKRRAAPSEAQEFIESAIPYDNDKCLIWPFGRTIDGYAAYRSRHAAQYICETIYGKRPSNGQTAHSCGDRLCINPRHLRWSTAKENALDKLHHGTWPTGPKNGRSMISEDQVREIRSLAGKISYRKMAKDFGISKSAIEAIINRKNWGYLK